MSYLFETLVTFGAMYNCVCVLSANECLHFFTTEPGLNGENSALFELKIRILSLIKTMTINIGLKY